MENTAKTASVALHQLPVLEVRVAGKIQLAKFQGGTYYTSIITPAKDEYSQPQRFVLVSKQKLGDVDQVINHRCSMNGWIRDFKFRDKNTGEQKDGQESNVSLTVIDL